MHLPGRARLALLRSDSVHRAAGGFPGVIGSARAEGRLIGDHAWVASHLLRALRMPKQVRVVPVLPDEDEMHGRHEHGHVRAAARRTRKGLGRHAEPTRVIGTRIVGPQFLFLGQLRVFFEEDSSLRLGHVSLLAMSMASTNSSPRRKWPWRKPSPP